ncbi:hypothetical protein L596_027775 [Steinernema carpocapsae]|uniref:PCI domain-containing protein n=1 Tax=Steinernema carpocapsae TaxID=34508 RepID=A0A4U5LWI2_STECR|nr:hypothetical protein L596_027775 [Steinernema carpocapsae]
MAQPTSTEAKFEEQLEKLLEMCEDAKEIPLEEISKALDLPIGDELDEFIAKALQTKEITAKIDEQSQKLIVYSVRPRTFQSKHWDGLKGAIGSAISKLNDVRRSIAQAVLNRENPVWKKKSTPRRPRNKN